MRRTEQKSEIRSFSGVERAEVHQRRFILHNSGTISTSGAGTLSSAFVTLDPSSCLDWGKISSYYDEFRVLGVKIRLVSNQQFSVTKLNDLLVCYLDNDSSSPDSFSTSLQRVHKSIIPAVFTHTNGRCWTRTFMRPVDKTSPVGWFDVAAPSSSPGAVCLVSQVATLTASTQYFTWQCELMVEARGAR